jgi:hypothetical protein
MAGEEHSRFLKSHEGAFEHYVPGFSPVPNLRMSRPFSPGGDAGFDPLALTGPRTHSPRTSRIVTQEAHRNLRIEKPTERRCFSPNWARTEDLTCQDARPRVHYELAQGSATFGYLR